jgi:hypothetical protein
MYIALDKKKTGTGIIRGSRVVLYYKVVKNHATAKNHHGR